MTEPFFEEVKEAVCGVVIQSTVRDATPEDIERAKQLHEHGQCPHNVVVDELGYLYDSRSCFTCGKGLGLV